VTTARFSRLKTKTTIIVSSSPLHSAHARPTHITGKRDFTWHWYECFHYRIAVKTENRKTLSRRMETVVKKKFRRNFPPNRLYVIVISMSHNDVSLQTRRYLPFTYRGYVGYNIHSVVDEPLFFLKAKRFIPVILYVI